jgi:Family of unknown function (DUF6361)
MSTLRWLATSERERQQARALVTAMQQKESRDELGIGSVRDAISDLLFPGTSTLQTRARYFLLIPWAYQQAVARGGKKALPARVRDAEVDVIAKLAASTGDKRGLIGRDAGAALQRMPSAVYWQGLHVWGVRRMPGPQSLIERTLTRRPASVARDDDGDALDGGGLGVWHDGLPVAPPGNPEGATFALSYAEADYLAERLRCEPGTRGSMMASLTALDVDHEQIDYAWNHPHLRTLPETQRQVVEQGRRFSLLMHGAAWIYNVILATMDERPDVEAEHRASYLEWSVRIEEQRDVFAAWDLAELWRVVAFAGVSVPPRTQLFVNEWLTAVCDDDTADLVDREDVRDLIIQRERRMKGSNARTANDRALKQWGGASGTLALDYRWSTARLLLGDIRSGLELADAAH